MVQTGNEKWSRHHGLDNDRHIQEQSQPLSYLSLTFPIQVLSKTSLNVCLHTSELKVSKESQLNITEEVPFSNSY